jgi:hypothetical protein
MKGVTFVIVHLGPDPDKHIFANIEYLRRNFSNALVVVTDNSKLISFCGQNNVLLSIYVRSLSTTNLFNKFDGDLEFRGGFWFLTIERIIAFTEFQADSLYTNLLHVESDVVLFKSFSIDFLAGTKKLCWTNVGPLYDCAALLFSPSPGTGDWLRNKLANELEQNRNTTDMLSLRRISQSHSNRVSYFPSTLDCYEKFPFIYDPLQFGMYLFGSDPRNLYGVINRYEWWSETGYSNSGIRYSTDLKGSLYVEKNSKKYRLLSLHNHSKNLLLFGRWQPLMVWFFVLSSRVKVFRKLPSYRFVKGNLSLLLSNITNYRKYPLIFRIIRGIVFR